MKRFPPFHDRYPKELVACIDSKGWQAFTGIQEAAITELPTNPGTPLPDAILEAETSSGKTEAVFLPLLAWISGMRRNEARGFSLLYVSPLRALINDQVGRIGPLAETIGLAVHRWHSGDDHRGHLGYRLNFRILVCYAQKETFDRFRGRQKNALALPSRAILFLLADVLTHYAL